MLVYRRLCSLFMMSFFICSWVVQDEWAMWEMDNAASPSLKYRIAPPPPPHGGRRGLPKSCPLCSDKLCTLAPMGLSRVQVVSTWHTDKWNSFAPGILAHLTIKVSLCNHDFLVVVFILVIRDYSPNTVLNKDFNFSQQGKFLCKIHIKQFALIDNLLVLVWFCRQHTLQEH